MSDGRLRQTVCEAIDIAKGNKPSPRIHWNGHDYVPASTITALGEKK